MSITLPRRGDSGRGLGRCSGRDEQCGHGGQGGPLPCRKCNPMLASNSRNSTLAMSISLLPCTLAFLAAVPPPPLPVAGPRYTTTVDASAHGHGSAPGPVGGPAI